MSADFIKARKEERAPAAPPGVPRRKHSRRKILALSGTGTLVLVASFGVWRATTRMLLDAQQRGWESGDHRAILIVGALVRSHFTYERLTLLGYPLLQGKGLRAAYKSL